MGHVENIPQVLIGAFREEARDLLADMESALLEIEARPRDREQIARAFRALHTIKGNGAMFGFAELEGLAHALEHVFDLLRKGRMAVTQEIIDLTLEAKDRLLALLLPGDDTPEERRLRGAIGDRIADILAGAGRPPAPAVAGETAGVSAPCAPAAAVGPGVDPPPTRSWRISIRPPRGLLAAGTDPLPVFAELRGLGACRIAASFDDVPPLAEMDPEACYLSWEILLETARGLEEIRGALLFLGGDDVVRIEPAPPPLGPTPAAPLPEARAGALQAAETGERGARRSAEAAQTLRVPSARLDTLVDLVGELVTVQARLASVAGRISDPELAGVGEEVERLTGELRHQTLSVRMVTIGPTFGKLRRHVRDLAREIGRDVELVTEGEDTELDKSVIDCLADPILHLLRNGIDHGIEAPQERERAGKPRRGTVRLSACHAGANVLIRVSDDGAGIDVEAVRRKAVARGLLAAGEVRSERELFALMFLPGFSTSTSVTTISGRGVGLDVVRRAVEALRGSVRVESRRGTGTTFEVRLPLTLAIIEGLDVVVGGDHYILPLAVVNECVELQRCTAAEGGRRRLAEIRGELVPYIRLRDWFSVDGAPPAREQIVVTEAEGLRLGCVVDEVVGEQQTVIKPLGGLFGGAPGLAGATILGDGGVALILDVAGLAQGVARAEVAGGWGAPASGAGCHSGSGTMRERGHGGD